MTNSEQFYKNFYLGMSITSWAIFLIFIQKNDLKVFPEYQTITILAISSALLSTLIYSNLDVINEYNNNKITVSEKYYKVHSICISLLQILPVAFYLPLMINVLSESLENHYFYIFIVVLFIIFLVLRYFIHIFKKLNDANKERDDIVKNRHLKIELLIKKAEELEKNSEINPSKELCKHIKKFSHNTNLFLNNKITKSELIEITDLDNHEE